MYPRRRLVVWLAPWLALACTARGAGPPAPRRPQPAPAPVAAPPAPDTVAATPSEQQHQRLRTSLIDGDRARVVDELRRVAAFVRELRGSDGDTAAVDACEQLVAPTVRDVARSWYAEGRPGHPDTYPATRVALEIYVDLFPDSDDAAAQTYRLAEVIAVLAWTRRERSHWLDAATWYERAAERDPAGTAMVDWRGTPAPLRDRAWRAQAHCLANAIDPAADVAADRGVAHVVIATYRNRLSRAPAIDEPALRDRYQLLEAIAAPEAEQVRAALWPIAVGSGALARIAREVLIARLAGAPDRERARWVERILAIPAVDADADLRACLRLLARSGQPCDRSPRLDGWIERPW